jgi:hypothetical protein
MNTDTPRTDEFFPAWDYYNDPFDAINHAEMLERELAEVTAQRDRLAEALRKIKNAGGTHNDPYDELDFIDGITYEALQSLNQSPNNA